MTRVTVIPQSFFTEGEKNVRKTNFYIRVFIEVIDNSHQDGCVNVVSSPLEV